MTRTDTADTAGAAEDPFAGLTAYDVVDGELMPRRTQGDSVSVHTPTGDVRPTGAE